MHFTCLTKMECTATVQQGVPQAAPVLIAEGCDSPCLQLMAQSVADYRKRGQKIPAMLRITFEITVE